MNLKLTVKGKKVRCTLVQALRLCTGHTTHRGSRGIALLFLDHGTRRGEGQRHAPAALYPQERPSTHCTGGWVGPRTGLDRCRKSRPPLGFDQTIQPVLSHYTNYTTQPMKVTVRPRISETYTGASMTLKRVTSLE